MPGNVVDTLVYDSDGRVTFNRVWHTNALTGDYFPAATIRETTYDYNDPVRVYRVMNITGWRDTTRSTYSGLGYLDSLIYSRRRYFDILGADQRRYNVERFSRDGLGDVMSSSSQSDIEVGSGYTSTTPAPRSMGFDATGRLRVISDPNERMDSVLYNAAGDQEFLYSVPNSNPLGTTRWFEDRASYYDAAGRTRATEWRYASWYRSTGGSGGISEGSDTWQLAFDEFRYDALGRRVVVRTRRANNYCSGAGSLYPIPQNIQSIRRTVWSGNQELWEIQMPGRTQDSATLWENDTLAVQWPPSAQYAPANGACYFHDPQPRWGRVGYVYGAALDQPLSITRFNHVDFSYPNSAPDSSAVFAPFAVVPHWNGRGTADYGLLEDGKFRRVVNNRYVLPQFQHAVFASAQEEDLVSQQVPNHTWPTTYTWLGSLVDDREDGSWLLYRRNRYLDPVTGRFTQEDPIGLAGGLNLYGFAAGDPMNFADPFGLRICFRMRGRQRARAVEAVQRVSQTSFTLDADGCTSQVEPTNGVWTKVGAGLAEMAKSENTVSIEFCNGCLISESAGLSVRIQPNDVRRQYGVGIEPNGFCDFRRGVNYDLGALMAHELGHVYDTQFAVVPDSHRAVNWENFAHVQAGRPRRDQRAHPCPVPVR